MASSRANTKLPGSRVSKPLILVAAEFNVEMADDLVDVLVDQADARGWKLLDIHMTGGSLSGEQTPAGALVTALPDEQVTQHVLETGCPVVRIGRLEHPDDSSSMPAVLPDYQQAGRMAVDYFAERGFRDLALVGHAQMKLKQSIEAGFRERAEQLGLKCHLLDFHNVDIPNTLAAKSDRYEKRSRVLVDWLDKAPKPVGLLACQPVIAGMVNVMCQRAGIAVPEQVALLSIKTGGTGRAQCELGPVPISVIEISRRDLSRVAAELLDFASLAAVFGELVLSHHQQLFGGSHRGDRKQ